MADPGAADAAEGATAANKDLWTRINAEYTDEQALRSWAAEDISWGVFNVPEAELDVLGDVAGLDVVDLACGTAYLSAWLARRGARAGASAALCRDPRGLDDDVIHDRPGDVGTQKGAVPLLLPRSLPE